jgi:UDPglucose 6-dehydrogenase
MATLGHDVIGIDTDKARVDALAAGDAPFYEPGLPELLDEALATGRLRFSGDIADVRGAEVHFICVGTPQLPGEIAADLTHVDAAFDSLVPHLSAGNLVVGKSTVPVGTAEQLAATLTEAGTGALLAWNPEFLREGHAVGDTLHPDRLVYGVPPGIDGDRAVTLLDDVYAATIAEGSPRLVTDLATAQLVKVAANSFLATKISFINAMAELCEATGADVTLLADAIGYDERIGREFLNAGLGFGGGCLPKDIRAFMARAGELGADQTLAFLHEVDAINNRRRVRMVEIARDECGGSIDGLRVAVLGASFKPNSDDVRDSPALDVADQLRLQGADVVVTDPQAIDNARAMHPELSFADSALEAATGADLVLLLTEWAEYVALDPETLGDVVRQRRIMDGRLALDPVVWRDAGWIYRSLGRP